MNMDFVRDLNETVALPPSAIKMDPSEPFPSSFSEQYSIRGTISTEEFINEIVQEILDVSLLLVRKNKDKNETKKDNGWAEI